MVHRLISGGQTGVDRAALDAALRLKVACGGWCPQGRLAEDGPIAGVYPLQETPSRNYQQRTRWNVRDSDGTLILKRGAITGGTALTIAVAQKLRRSFLVCELNQALDEEVLKRWVHDHQIHCLNVAGPRESSCPGIYQRALAWMMEHRGIWK